MTTSPRHDFTHDSYRDTLALEASREIEGIYLAKNLGGPTQCLAKVQTIVRQAIDKAIGEIAT